MGRFGELIPSDELVSFLEKVDVTISKIMSLEERFGEMEVAIAEIHAATNKHLAKEFYLVHESAEIVNRRPFTVREWCRNGRLWAKKTPKGGDLGAWRISHEELIRYQNEGLLPERRNPIE